MQFQSNLALGSMHSSRSYCRAFIPLEILPLSLLYFALYGYFCCLSVLFYLSLPPPLFSSVSSLSISLKLSKPHYFSVSCSFFNYLYVFSSSLYSFPIYSTQTLLIYPSLPAFSTMSLLYLYSSFCVYLYASSFPLSAHPSTLHPHDSITLFLHHILSISVPLSVSACMSLLSPSQLTYPLCITTSLTYLRPGLLTYSKIADEEPCHAH